MMEEVGEMIWWLEGKSQRCLFKWLNKMLAFCHPGITPLLLTVDKVHK